MAALPIGVLALQGDFAEHARILRALGQQPVEIRLPEQLDGLAGLIIPGGESTTIGQLAEDYGLLGPLRAAIDAGLPVWGTCAGLILLADDIDRDQPLVGGLAVVVERNAFGRQVDSFETDLDIVGLEAGGRFRAVFIRAPLVRSAGEGVEVLARLDDGKIVAVRQGGLLGTSFHPELTEDARLHELFVEICRQSWHERGLVPAAAQPRGDEEEPDDRKSPDRQSAIHALAHHPDGSRTGDQRDLAEGDTPHRGRDHSLARVGDEAVDVEV
jgi:5'-phosphate synthase pdxT subunit